MPHNFNPIPEHPTAEQRAALVQERIDHVMDDPLCPEADECIADLETLLIHPNIDFTPLRGMIKRIYDLSESDLQQTSNANTGMLGTLNRRSSRKRHKKYFKKVRRQKPGRNYVRVYAEGDSWFQFPTFITDTIDWLNKRDDLLIYSDAYGGDWLTNILYEAQYVQGLSKFKADVFLISGGGNDLVGDYRLSIMVTQNPKMRKYDMPDEIGVYQDPNRPNAVLTDEERRQIFNGQRFISREFYRLLRVFQLQYTLFFSKLYGSGSTMKDLISITQGYDFPIPRSMPGFSLRYPLQPIINKLLSSGKWLHQPLMVGGVLEPQDQRDIMRFMIYEFNEMLIPFSQKYNNVFHIDSRGVANGTRDWYDELHLKGRKFREVADAFERVIDNHVSLRQSGKKVIRTTHH